MSYRGGIGDRDQGDPAAVVWACARWPGCRGPTARRCVAMWIGLSQRGVSLAASPSGYGLESYNPNIEWNEPGGGNAPGRVAAFRERTPTEVLSGPRLTA